MPINWKDLLNQAIEAGQDEAVKFLNEHREFIENLPQMALEVFISVLPGKRKMTPDRLWMVTLRNMSRAERDHYNKLMMQDAVQASQFVMSKMKVAKFFEEAAGGLSELGRSVVGFMLEAAIKTLTEKATG